MSIQKLSSGKFTSIVQLSDIHIRLTKRHGEYEEVFKRLRDDLKKMGDDVAIFVLGDVVNSKIDLSPECVNLAAELLFDLAESHPTVLIAGNHDTNLANKHRMDSLSPIVSALNHNNLFYLKESGLYALGNICINNYGVFDTPDKYIKGSDIPSVYRNQYEYFVALYHGTVDGAKTDLGFVLSNPAINIAIFDGHDIAMLGDIHMIQDLQSYDEASSKPTIHYCGSLIQQKHDEPLTGHGYSQWDLKKRNYKHVELKNDYGFFSVMLDNGVLTTDLTNIPNKARIRFQLKNTMPTEVKAALTSLRKTTEVIESCFQKMDYGTPLTRIPTATGNVVLGNIHDKNYQASLLTDFLKNKLKVTDQSFIDSIIEINNDTNNLIKRDDFAKNIRWIPIKFEWDNMFSYGEGNVIEFSKMKELIGLFAPNTSGKSSIFSAFTFCLFDKCEREYKAVNILNVKKTTFRCKFEFEIDGKNYFIERVARADKKGKVKVDVRFWKLENGQEIDLNGEQRKDTNEIIREYLGSYEDFVLTTLSVQNGKNNASIIDMGDTDRKDLFAQFMGLTVFDRLHVEANEILKEKVGQLKAYKDDDYTQKLISCENFLEQANSFFNEQTKSIEELTKSIEKAQNEILTATQKLHKLEAEIPSLESSESSKKKHISSIRLRKEYIATNQKETKSIEDRIILIEKNVSELENKEITKSKETVQKLSLKKKELEGQLEKVKLNYNHDLEIYNKSKALDYDPNCEFCVKNAGTVATDAKSAMVRINVLKLKATELKELFDDITTQLEGLSWVTDADFKYQKFLKEQNTLKNEQLRLAGEIQKDVRQLSMLEDELKQDEKNIELYNKNVEYVKYNAQVNANIELLRQILANKEFELKDKNKKLMDINGKMSVCKNQISEINKTVDKIKKIEQQYKLYEVYCKAVSRDGIPFDIITATVPEVQNEVNNILSQIADFTSSFETDDKNIIPYIVYNDTKWLMSLTSGFEKFALSLAIRVALINISNLPRPNFMIIDEGFGVLDAENLSSMHMLFDYLKTNFDFIMIVSHLESMRDVVDKHLEIIKDGGFSKVEYK